jgi:hypothetical protein
MKHAARAIDFVNSVSRTTRLQPCRLLTHAYQLEFAGPTLELISPRREIDGERQKVRKKRGINR